MRVMKMGVPWGLIILIIIIAAVWFIIGPDKITGFIGGIASMIINFFHSLMAQATMPR
jgi:Sec-independent protein translocase protein TatA